MIGKSDEKERAARLEEERKECNEEEGETRRRGNKMSAKGWMKEEEGGK